MIPEEASVRRRSSSNKEPKLSVSSPSESQEFIRRSRDLADRMLRICSPISFIDSVISDVLYRARQSASWISRSAGLVSSRTS